MCQLHYHITHHFLNVIKGPVDTYIIPGVTMAEHDCSSFTIKNDYGSEASSQIPYSGRVWQGESLANLANRP